MRSDIEGDRVAKEADSETEEQGEWGGRGGIVPMHDMVGGK